jgi:hypothetical protein
VFVFLLEFIEHEFVRVKQQLLALLYQREEQLQIKTKALSWGSKFISGRTLCYFFFLSASDNAFCVLCHANRFHFTLKILRQSRLELSAALILSVTVYLHSY